MTDSPQVVVGVDIGGTTTQVVLCTAELDVLDRTEVPTPASEGGTAMLDAALSALRLLLDRTPARLLGVGVGAAGLVDVRAGRILVASDSFRDWAGFEVTATVQQALGVPAFLDNDVNAFLRGEVAKGAVAGAENVLGMTLGTGVGGALWLNGALYEGRAGRRARSGTCPGSVNCRVRAGEEGIWRRWRRGGRSRRGTGSGRGGRSRPVRSPRRPGRAIRTRGPCTRRWGAGSPVRC